MGVLRLINVLVIRGGETRFDRFCVLMEEFRSFLSSTLKRDNSLNIREPNLSETSTSDSESESEDESPMASTNLEQFIDGSSLHEYIIRLEAFLLLNRVTNDVAKSVHFVNLIKSLIVIVSNKLTNNNNRKKYFHTNTHYIVVELPGISYPSDLKLLK